MRLRSFAEILAGSCMTRRMNLGAAIVFRSGSRPTGTRMPPLRWIFSAPWLRNSSRSVCEPNDGQLRRPIAHDITPSGWYMLAIVHAGGIPSKAIWVELIEP